MELLIAVALTAVVGLLSALFVDSTFRVTQRITESTRVFALNADAAMIWRDLLLHVHRTGLANETPRPFVGDAGSVQLASDCPGAQGFRRRCGVFAQTVVTSDGSGLQFSVDDRTWFLRTVGPVSLRFLERSSSDGVWVSVWSESERVPAGIALVGRSDTLVYRVGVLR